MQRSSGVLMPIFSLPGPYGIGTLGKRAHQFANWLQSSGQKWWQILPTGPTSFGDSPYQPVSAFAGNPYFIDLELLCEDGLLHTYEFLHLLSPSRVNYEYLYNTRADILRLAYRRGWKRDHKEVVSFIKEQSGWLDDYSLYMSIKETQGGQPWREWPNPLRTREESAIAEVRREYKDQIQYHTYIQYLFYKQYRALKAHCSELGIGIIGDIPLYLADDCAEVWAHPELFWLDDDYKPVFVAGCPPDYFSPTGQLWGNPLYRWDKMKADNYRWWKTRLAHAVTLFDKVRIDHFRGFSTYYAIPNGDKTAENGHWETGPGAAFFAEAERELGMLPIIAEDLGDLSPDVFEMLEETGYPGMKVLQFAFDSDAQNAYLPHNHVQNCVIYTGTHDNDTAAGWFASVPEHVREHLLRYLCEKSAENAVTDLVQAALQSTANLCILPLQDILQIGAEGRINTPGTSSDKNWSWRLSQKRWNTLPEKAQELRARCELYGRI